MKITRNMDLADLAILCGTEGDLEKTKSIRRRLAMVWAGEDTSVLTPTEWDKVKNVDSSLGRQVDSMLSQMGGCWAYFNRKTNQVAFGFTPPNKTGNRSVDASWVNFEIAGATPVEAEPLVRAYIALPGATFTNMFVQILVDEQTRQVLALNGDRQFNLPQ